MKLDRLISNLPDYSRHSARLLIASGQVCVDGLIVRDVNAEIDRFMSVTLNGQCIQAANPARYLLLHKPVGFLSATQDPQHPTVLECLPAALRSNLHIAGRLDRSSSGLLLLTNDGLWSRRITAPEKKTPKVYLVSTAYPLSPDTAERFARGMYFAHEGIMLQPAYLQQLSPCQARLTIHEGRYHQIKRMFHAVGNRVTSLHRESMGSIVLDPGLRPGEYRPLTQDEVASI
ncbi:MAG: 16S rRNA pseudouridine(516) synthase [Gammaproteobacteria bacterium HGW-Gammaproteobacteria-6]|nr:MAG: 16S rRNA pseudouridine(516) synthase [Gammaproteobacteria bacterium HGW-Gammaproteobacteria-6]